MIQYDRFDTYDSLPDKTFAGYQFFAQKCPDKEYAAFVDDDVFIKVHQFKEQMKKISPGTFHTCDNMF